LSANGGGAGPYVLSYERIAVRAGVTTANNGAWVWFDDPVIITLAHRDTAILMLEAQAERAAMTHGLDHCRRIILWAWGEQMAVDWDQCLASLNANDPRWRSRIGNLAN
jgi:hypothetical protein